MAKLLMNCEKCGCETSRRYGWRPKSGERFKMLCFECFKETTGHRPKTLRELDEERCRYYESSFKELD